MKIETEALDAMKQRAREGTRWAAYQSQAFDSCTFGELRFLLVGQGCTFAEPPPRYPDTQHGTGWRHLFVGWVDLTTGTVQA